MIDARGTFRLFPYLSKWLLMSGLVAALAGSASALFLFLLDRVTETRETYPWLLFGLPLAGFAIAWVYHVLGRDEEAGNNLLLEEIQDPKRVVRFRMAPLVLVGTVISHLFGASVGREGTAVQMGASLADQLTPVLRLDRTERRLLLMSGMSAGFASVFGTPLAGAIFGFEVLTIGGMRYDALLPCFLAAVLADQVALLWGVQHTHYAIAAVPSMGAGAFAAALAAGVAFGLAARAFAGLTHAAGALFRRIGYPPLRPVLGGTLVVVAVLALGTDRYIGLGIPVIQEAFTCAVLPWDFLGKTAFTVVSLGSGLKGGEVTPLFYVGATLGNALAPLLDLPVSLLAAMGFAAVFAGAANTPIAGTVLAMELFGAECGSFVGIACVLSYFCSGPRGIYRAQGVAQTKLPPRPDPGRPDPDGPRASITAESRPGQER